MDTTNDAQLVMHWVEVPDTRGGSRLEARWHVAGAAVTLAPAVMAAQAA